MHSEVSPQARTLLSVASRWQPLTNKDEREFSSSSSSSSPSHPQSIFNAVLVSNGLEFPSSLYIIFETHLLLYKFKALHRSRVPIRRGSWRTIHLHEVASVYITRGAFQLDVGGGHHSINEGTMD